MRPFIRCTVRPCYTLLSRKEASELDGHRKKVHERDSDAPPVKGVSTDGKKMAGHPVSVFVDKDEKDKCRTTNDERARPVEWAADTLPVRMCREGGRGKESIGEEGDDDGDVARGAKAKISKSQNLDCLLPYRVALGFRHRQPHWRPQIVVLTLWAKYHFGCFPRSASLRAVPKRKASESTCFSPTPPLST